MGDRVFVGFDGVLVFAEGILYRPGGGAQYRCGGVVGDRVFVGFDGVLVFAEGILYRPGGGAQYRCGGVVSSRVFVGWDGVLVFAEAVPHRPEGGAVLEKKSVEGLIGSWSALVLHILCNGPAVVVQK